MVSACHVVSRRNRTDDRIQMRPFGVDRAGGRLPVVFDISVGRAGYFIAVDGGHRISEFIATVAINRAMIFDHCITHGTTPILQRRPDSRSTQRSLRAGLAAEVVALERV